MAKKKKNRTQKVQSRNPDLKGNLVTLQDCTKNMECGISTADNIKVIVFYNGINYKVKIVVPKRNITKNIITAKNSKFDLYLNFHDTLYSNSGGNLYIELNCKYRINDRRKKTFECNPVKISINSKRYHGTIILQPDFFIPEEWSPSVNSLEDEIAYKHYRSDIRKMEMGSKIHVNYEKNNVHKPFQGGDCTGGR